MSTLDGDADSPVLFEYVDSPAVNAELRSLKEAVEAESMEMDPEPPTLIITLNGKIVQEITVDSEKLLIGRSSMSDISISHEFISKHHALVMKSGNALLIMDLNSRNGIFVNSKRITSKALRHEDIISIGDHRIKVIDVSTRSRPLLGELDISSTADTTAMKNIDDMRREKTRKIVRRATETKSGNLLD